METSRFPVHPAYGTKKRTVPMRTVRFAQQTDESGKKKDEELQPRANKAVFKELWCNPNSGVTPFSLFKRIFPHFSILLFPLCQLAAVLS